MLNAAHTQDNLQERPCFEGRMFQMSNATTSSLPSSQHSQQERTFPTWKSVFYPFLSLEDMYLPAEKPVSTLQDYMVPNQSSQLYSKINWRHILTMLFFGLITGSRYNCNSQRSKQICTQSPIVLSPHQQHLIRFETHNSVMILNLHVDI